MNNNLSFIMNAHPEYYEQLYKNYTNDPNSVDIEWQYFFKGFDLAYSSIIAQQPNTSPIKPNDETPAISNEPIPKKIEEIVSHKAKSYSDDDPETLDSLDKVWKEIQVYRLISGYRNKGHLIAKTNPIRERKDRNAQLDLNYFNLKEQDLQERFLVSNIIGLTNATLQEIIDLLQKTYTQHIGIEYKYISNQEIIDWIKNHIEYNFFQPFPNEKRKRILEKINQAVVFENFLQKKFVGQKRFSLEGGETTIAALDAIIQKAGSFGVKEIIIGMAHRGRLNVLANILNKTYENIFNEFETEKVPENTMGSGDVKYHLGYSSEIKYDDQHSIYLKLMPNPSHLEAVDPVLLGYTRANADILYDSDFSKILPILVHGDSSIAGQGVVYEIAQMSKLKGYHTGGTIHFIINNQIGFTTDFDDARSSDYCTSLAALIQAPVLHVNGDNPEAVVRCVELATEFRQKYQSDIFIDMVCYRKHGHNENDDPKYTQPSLYKLIENHRNVRELYTEYLFNIGEPALGDLVKEMEQKFWIDLQDRLDEVKQNSLPYTYQPPQKQWSSMLKNVTVDEIFDTEILTKIEASEFKELFSQIMNFPQNFTPLPKIKKLFDDKIKLLEDNKIDWATAELLAYASILNEGKTVRISGQDVQRGTFSHRHAIIFDANNFNAYNRLNFIVNNQPNQLKVYNSLLSEYGVLGFEYGYALAHPDALVIWEAQFGDFANGAQTIIDQFIAAGEQKWQRQNGLVMLLPHGYEGQGPEHSSARIERFLQLAAENNIIITNITMAANFFHLLRRQISWNFRKPLINFSPKSNLRSSYSLSHIKEFINGSFNPVLDDPLIDLNRNNISKILLCSGKIYFELYERQLAEKNEQLAIIRLEQLYPLPEKQLHEILMKYPKYLKKEIKFYWVQEEPLNMGCAAFLIMNLKLFKFGIISRKSSASTASGFAKIHQKEQNDIINTAFKV